MVFVVCDPGCFASTLADKQKYFRIVSLSLVLRVVSEFHSGLLILTHSVKYNITSLFKIFMIALVGEN